MSGPVDWTIGIHVAGVVFIVVGSQITAVERIGGEGIAVLRQQQRLTFARYGLDIYQALLIGREYPRLLFRITKEHARASDRRAGRAVRDVSQQVTARGL